MATTVKRLAQKSSKKASGNLAALRAVKKVRRGSVRPESKTVVEHNRWLMAHAPSVAAAARENTKRLVGKEIL